MDFYNYAGIHRDVIIYIKPVYAIQDLSVKTDYLINMGSILFNLTKTFFLITFYSFIGSINYEIIHNCPKSAIFSVTIKDKNNNVAARSSLTSDNLIIENAMAWWPKGMKMNGTFGYLYSMEVNKSLNKCFITVYLL